MKRCCLGPARFQPRSSTVILNNLLADRQPEACAFWLVGESVSDLLELFEHLWLICGRDADAGVGYADNHAAIWRDEQTIDP